VAAPDAQQAPSTTAANDAKSASAVAATVANAVPASAPVADAAAAAAPAATTEGVTAAAAAAAIATQVAKSAQPIMAGAAPELSVKATAEGALIGLTDDAAYSMFPVGSSVPDAKVVALMTKIAEALTSQPGKVVIRGYTDGRPFHSADNDNWRLSAARARVAYDLLVRGGLQESRVVAIEGHADRDLLNPADPYAAENRRIEILLVVDG
jgi:chemotaxis protein MotB